MIVFPNAKINIGLQVLSKLDSGYHEIETIFYPLGLSDALEIIPAKEFSFGSSGLSIPGDPNQNLVIKAYQMMKDRFDLPPVAIHLHKIIPMGAGLGGGSSDAAYTLKVLNEMFSICLTLEQLEDMARDLGADCAFFIQNKAVFASGRGDRFETIDLDLSIYKIVIVKPEVHLSTAWAFSQLKPAKRELSLKKLINFPVKDWQDQIKNDFEEVLFFKHPEIKRSKNLLIQEGAIYASMTGSGSAVFGLFEEVPNIKGIIFSY
jgi:4-diphosphocytidyl-2-C-methyl-D-erythritol kinase